MSIADHLDETVAGGARYQGRSRTSHAMRNEVAAELVPDGGNESSLEMVTALSEVGAPTGKGAKRAIDERTSGDARQSSHEDSKGAAGWAEEREQFIQSLSLTWL